MRLPQTVEDWPELRSQIAQASRGIVPNLFVHEGVEFLERAAARYAVRESEEAVSRVPEQRLTP